MYYVFLYSSQIGGRMWVEKGEGRREWGWEEKGEEERKMNHFPDLVVFDSIIPSERNKV